MCKLSEKIPCGSEWVKGCAGNLLLVSVISQKLISYHELIIRFLISLMCVFFHMRHFTT